MTKIEILTPKRQNGYFVLPVIFTFLMPEKFENIPNKLEIAQSYSSNYGVIVIDDVEYFTLQYSLTFSDNISNESIKTHLEELYEESEVKLQNFQLAPYDELIGCKFNGIKWE